MAVEILEKEKGVFEKMNEISRKGNWITIDVSYSKSEGGSGTKRIIFPVEKEELLERFKPGMGIELYKKKDTWYLDLNELKREKEKSAEVSKDEYWRKKFEYEIGTDKQTSLRSLFITISNTFNAALPLVSDKPKTLADVDSVIEEAWAKAQELNIRLYSKKDEE